MCYASLHSLSISLVRFMQPRWSAPNEGNNVMVAHDPEWGNGHSIFLARHETWISSNHLTTKSIELTVAALPPSGFELATLQLFPIVKLG